MIGDRGLQDNFTLHGDFWVPEAPAQRIVGTLTNSDGRIELALIGAFDSLRAPLSVGPLEIILGTTDAGACTLWRSHPTETTHRSFGETGVARSRLVSTFLFLGESFESADRIRFEEVRFRFDALEEWLATVPFVHESEPGAGDQRAQPVARHVFPEAFRNCSSERSGQRLAIAHVHTRGRVVPLSRLDSASGARYQGRG